MNTRGKTPKRKPRAAKTAEPPPARARPGPKPRFTREQVVDVALEITRAEGLNAVSLRRVADELGITAMALYRYFDSKDQLLTAMAARMVNPAPMVDADAPWPDQVRTVALDIDQGLLSHPGIGHLFATRVLDAADVDAAKEGLYGILYGAGFTAQESIDGLWTLFDYIVGAVIADESVDKQTSPEEMSHLAGLPDEEFPTLTTVAPSYKSRGSRGVFEFGLDLLIRGLEARLDARR